MPNNVKRKASSDGQANNAGMLETTASFRIFNVDFSKNCSGRIDINVSRADMVIEEVDLESLTGD